jgi:hypothetical protein
MEHVRQRMEEIKQLQRKRMQGSSQTIIESGPAYDRSQYLIALGGVAVGLMIAAVIWLTKPMVTEDNINSISPEAAEAINASEIKKTNDNIARLNHRMELLTDTISNMDAKFKRIMVIADSMTNIENKHAYSSQQFTPDSTVEVSAFDNEDSNASRVDNIAHETEKAFVPTHTINTRINLRPSTSLNTTPIAVLNVGTEVEYISEIDGWYYVNTQSHGKGWCSSDYLSPLL